MTTSGDPLQEAKDENLNLHIRIKELESCLDDSCHALTNSGMATHVSIEHLGHHLTDEMIDEAVEWANTFGPEAITTRDRWEVLNIFHIFRCEECGGSGKRKIERPWKESVHCPGCNGKGWVIHE